MISAPLVSYWNGNGSAFTLGLDSGELLSAVKGEDGRVYWSVSGNLTGHRQAMWPATTYCSGCQEAQQGLWSDDNWMTFFNESRVSPIPFNASERVCVRVWVGCQGFRWNACSPVFRCR